jgi:type VI secretion system protein ImpL
VLSGDGTVRAAFTQAGWNFVQSASKNAGNTGAPDDACVIGSSQGGVSLLKQDQAEKKIQELFVKDYIDQWQKFVAGFSVVSYNSPDDAIRRLDILSGHTSPLLAVLKMAAEQTDFSVPVETGVLAGAKKTVTNTLNNIIGSAEKKLQPVTGATTPTDQGTSSVADITRFFQPVQYVVPPGSDKWINEKNTGYMDALSGLRTAIATISRPSADTPPDPQAGQTAKDKAEDSVRQLAKGFNSEGVGTLDRDVTRLLEEPIANAERFLAPPSPDLKTNAAAKTFCNSFQPLLKKYPFSPSAPESPVSEATLKDLQDYFAPDEGKIWKFQKSALVDLTTLDGKVWKPNPASQKLKPTQELLDFLNWAQQLRMAFFSDGNSPHLTYSLRTVLASGSKQVIQLTIDGQSHEFTADHQLQHTFTWPAAAGVEAKADGRSGTAGYTAGFDSHYGLWAAFRLFGDAIHREPGAVAIEWKETKGGTGRPQPLEPPVQLEFVGGFPAGVDVFNPDFFKGFGCPLKAAQ